MNIPQNFISSQLNTPPLPPKKMTCKMRITYIDIACIHRGIFSISNLKSYNCKFLAYAEYQELMEFIGLKKTNN